MTDDARETIVAPAAQRARDVGGHRKIYVAGVLAVLSILALAALMLLRTSTQQAQIDALSASAADNHATAQKLYDQVLKLGGTPSVQPPAVTGGAGPQGAQGVQGVSGAKGDKGDPGANGTNGTSPPCLSTPAQCQGANGTDGQPGAAGQPGQDGATGAKGDQGDKGDMGAQGPPGPTCPDGYTLTPVIVLGADGTTHQGVVCVANTSTSAKSSNVRKG